MRRLLFGVLSLASLVALAWISVRSGSSFGEIAGLVPVEIHVLALGAFLLDFACRGTRLSLLAEKTGASLSLSRALEAQFGGEAAGAVTPAFDTVLPAADLAGTLVWWRIYTHYLAALVGGGVLLARAARQWGEGAGRETPARDPA